MHHRKGTTWRTNSSRATRSTFRTGTETFEAATSTPTAAIPPREPSTASRPPPPRPAPRAPAPGKSCPPPTRPPASPSSAVDLVYLRNTYGGDGGYLDTNSGPTTDQKNSGAKFDVSTSRVKDRAPGTGHWRIFAQTSTPANQNVRIGDTVLLWNVYGDNGGFLETNGGTTDEGAAYDVCTNAYFNRSSNVADWKIHKAQS